MPDEIKSTVLLPEPISFPHDAVHFSQRATARLAAFDHDYDGYLAQYGSDESGRLLCVHTSETSWSSWEVHPEGDEIVLVLSGHAEFLQRIHGKERKIRVGPLQAIINPRGVEHTANVISPFTALFLTPCLGTFHVERVVDDRLNG